MEYTFFLIVYDVTLILKALQIENQGQLYYKNENSS